MHFNYFSYSLCITHCRVTIANYINLQIKEAQTKKTLDHLKTKVVGLLVRNVHLLLLKAHKACYLLAVKNNNQILSLSQCTCEVVCDSL